MADNHYMRIAITPELIFDSESAFIQEILSHGWDMVHLRHPSASLRDMQNLIESIPQKYHHRLRLHGHFELLNRFKLGGIHLNRRCPAAPENYSGPHSRSCHTIEELSAASEPLCDYVTLSPIFDSVSKTGYKAAFSEKELREIDKITDSGVNKKVIALGGVKSDNFKSLAPYGFAGFAVLGALMNATSTDDLRLRLSLFDNARQTPLPSN